MQVLDFCGELNRYAVQRATARDEAKVRACRDLVEEIMDQVRQRERSGDDDGDETLLESAMLTPLFFCSTSSSIFATRS